MNSRAILGTALAVVWVFAMMTNPVLAVPPQLTIASVMHNPGTGCTITLNGPPGTAQKGHDIIVYVCLSVPLGSSPQTAWLAAIHPTFNDDPAEQTPGMKKIHGHSVMLDAANCVVGIGTGPSATVSGNTVTITFGMPSTVAAVVGYDITGAGICPTTVYDVL